jgi:dienelactone hydrolase
MKKILPAFIFSLLLLCSCSSDAGKNKTTAKEESKDTVPPKEQFVAGKIIDKVVNLTDPSQDYALYLPSGYNADKPLPVIYFFDAHAAGKLPLAKYQELAERNGYILIGSNNSKNGTTWEETQSIAAKLFSDSQQRLAINTSRIYLCGFSGGARVANALCILNGGISGVICCGAASPAANSKDPRSNYTFLGICGTKDFNYIEMRKYDMVDLSGHGVKHAFIEFDGKHEWPDSGTMGEGFLWLELSAMRKDASLKNEAFIKENFDNYSKRISALQDAKKTFETYNLVKKTVNFFDGLTDLKNYFDLYAKLKNDPAVDKELKKEEESWKKEGELQSYYQQAFQEKNLDWWRQDVASINKKIKSGSKEEALMFQRTLDYLSLVAYMQTNAAMQQNSLPAAEIFSGVYLLVDPTNNEAHYLAAEIAAVKGNEQQAIAELNAALEYGFKDINRLQNDQLFGSISTMDEFRAVQKKVNEAAAADK